MGAGKRSYTGGQAFVIWHRAVLHAARAVLQLPPDQLSGLNVRAGEHLAAILATAFLGVAPSSIDTHGDVDLWFRLSDTDTSAFPLLPDGKSEAAFETKSMPGPFRKFDHSIDVARARGDLHDLAVTVKVETANEILASARPLLARARNGLLMKTAGHVSRNAFLIVHPFDRFAVETYESPVIGAALAPLDVDVDTVWVLWVPDHLTMWSTEDRRWTDLLFTGTSPNEAVSMEPESLTVLQRVESEFLATMGHQAGSPYLFGLSATETGE